MTRRLAGLSLGPLLAWVLIGLPGAGAAAAASGATPADLQRYREAHGLLAGGDYAAAQAAFEALPPGFLLADYAAFFAAESLVRGGDEAAALERFRLFPERFPEAVLAPAAALAAHDTAFRLGRFAEAEREARRFLQRWPAHPEGGRILVRLAEARAAQGQVADAVADLRRRWLESPASPWGEAARESLEELGRRTGVAMAPFTPDEQYGQAVRYMDASEFTEAARLLGELLARDPDPALRHRTVLRLAQSLRRLGKSAEAVPVVQTALAESATGWRPELLYELTRLQTRTGQSPAAVPVLERLLAEHADAKVAPDAWLTLARLRLELGQPAAARVAFQGLLTAYPDHAVAASARWELAWLEYRAQRFRDAALAFRQLSSNVASYRLAGLYWAARSLEAAREPAAASALLKDVLARGPQTYYGVLAERRLRSRTPVPPVAAPVRLAADPLAVLAPDVHYQKARALAGLGFQGAALTELESLVREAGVEPERAWGLGVAFAQFGEAGRSLRQLRRAFGASAEGGAAGLTPAFWRLFYPLGYADHVRAAAQRAGVDPFFVAAVIREESSYDPRAKSWVGAIGLMQLMPETARVVASDLRVPLGDLAELWEPPVNITLGASYLGQLRARFGEPLLAAAGYNAGPHRVDRWLGERRTADLEEFVDQIPFDETRAFVKRVASSWHQYQRLYGSAESAGSPRGTSTWGARTRP